MSEHDSDTVLAMIRWFYVGRYPTCRGVSPALLNARVHKVAKSLKLDDLAEHAIDQYDLALKNLIHEIDDFPGELCDIIEEVHAISEDDSALRKTLSGVLADNHRMIFGKQDPAFADLRKLIAQKNPSLGLDILSSMASNVPKYPQDTDNVSWLRRPVSIADLAHRPGRIARRASLVSADSEVAVHKHCQTPMSSFDPNESDVGDSWLQAKNAGGKTTDKNADRLFEGAICTPIEQEEPRTNIGQKSWYEVGTWPSKIAPALAEW